MLRTLLLNKSEDRNALFNDLIWLVLIVSSMGLVYLSLDPNPEIAAETREKGYMKLLTLQFIVVLTMQIWYLQYRLRRYLSGGTYRDIPARITLAKKAYRKRHFESVFWVPTLVCLAIFLINQVLDPIITGQYFALHIGITTWKEPWRLLLSQIFHYNIMHFGLNIGIFMVLGRYLAVWYTRREMVHFLLVAFTLPAFLNLVLGYPLGIIRSDYWSIGLSMVTYAGLGAFMVAIGYYHKVMGTVESVWTLLMGVIFIIALTLLQEGRINHEGHILGTLVGIGWAVLHPPKITHVKKILREGRRIQNQQDLAKA